MATQAATAIRPVMTNPMTRTCSLALSWVVVRCRDLRSSASLVEWTVKISITTPTMVAAAPAYMTLTAFSTWGGTGGLSSRGIWVPAGYGSYM
jgi:hypothetical protein